MTSNDHPFKHRRASATNLLLAAALALACPAVHAQAASAPPIPATQPKPPVSLTQAIDAYIAQPQFARADWGIAVRSLDTGKLLYRHNADRLFVPASNAKLFTAGLALATLGSNTRIATTLYATNTRIDAKGNLHADLILYGRGDPSLGLGNVSPDWADELAAALAQAGVKRIRGDLIADATYFTGTPIGNGWEANDLQTWFGAIPSALNVQGNLMHVDVTRDTRSCCAIKVTPGAAAVQVVNQTADNSSDPLGLYRPIGSSTLFAVGRLPSKTRKHSYVLSMPDPARTAGNLLREALARQDITLTGKVEVLHWPESDPALARSGTRAIAHIDSPMIAVMVDHMLKDSDNLYAQSLLLQAGVVAAQRKACAQAVPPDTSAAWALCALRGLLATAGIPSDAVLLSEGSGLARRDLVTPNAFVKWLAWTQTQAWGPDLRNALPVAGIDGTLAHRFLDGAATANLQAKTGTLSHDYTLTGFVTNAGGKHLVFSIMLNRYPRWEVASEYPDAPSPRVALDDIARLITQSGVR
ncbi:MAG TPA: D-alanyl-D-alanine carboxypeptidase/D-alanyl-D-alanine-endopeptidase [Rhodanobacteraceae bacterium]|jgi:D-alanyl-D-alanine carboxypeptidase/D-alanyl-D-alanine-endopeptidase (penicillin-binding protein 4)|nr:D-alanyl-D-alanine carboxypeptidase/D-alanyl-D-alanine-endopeptidase [Rhodanobacteraceae bacterium]